MKEVTLLGMGTSLNHLPGMVPGEIWGQNKTYERTSRKMDKLFFFDDHRIFGVEDLNRLDTVIVTKESIPGLKNYVVYPLKNIIETLNPKRKYFVNTTAYMLAYAIYLGYERIRTYGIDMMNDKEYLTAQRPCVEYWVGFAESRGIEVIISPGSMVCNHNGLYGYEKEKHEGGSMTFISKFLGHKLYMGDNLIEFKLGRFQTEDKDIINYLSHPKFQGIIVKADPASYGIPGTAKNDPPAASQDKAPNVPVSPQVPKTNKIQPAPKKRK